MLGRLISNLVLGFFVVTLVVVYGVAKQQPTFQVKEKVAATTNDAEQATPQVLSEESTKKLAIASVPALVVPNGEKITVRVADDAAEREQGLSDTDPLPQGQGMLFVFEVPGSYGIWMKDMHYNLDILWLDAEGRIVKVVEDAPAPEVGAEASVVYRNPEPAMYVLEVGAGEVSRLGLNPGDQIKVY